MNVSNRNKILASWLGLVALIGAIAGCWRDTQQSVTAPDGLRQHPVMLALHSKNPELYRTVAADTREMMAIGLSQEQIANRIFDHHMPILLRHFYPYASDEAIVENAEVLLEELEYLQEKDISACTALLAGKTSATQVNHLLHPDLIKKDIATVAQIINSASTDTGSSVKLTSPALTSPAFSYRHWTQDPDMKNVIAAIAEQHLGDVNRVMEPAAAGKETEDCELAIAFIKEILSYQTPYAAKLVRLLWNHEVKIDPVFYVSTPRIHGGNATR